MATPFQSIVYSNVQNYRIAELLYATAGFTFAHATEAGSIGLRKGATLKRTVEGPTDAAGRPIVDRVKTSTEAEGLQSGLLNLKNALTLSSGFHQLRLKDDSGKYFNFVEFAGTFGTPTGSQLVGLNFEWMLASNERGIKYTWDADMANTQWDYILAQAASGATGGASGTSGGLTASSYGRSNFKRSGIKSITCDGVNIGVTKDFKLTIKSDAVNRDDWNRPINRQLLVEMEVVMLQSTANDLLGVSTTAEQLDKAWVVNTAEDETITFASGALGVYGETETGDSNAFTKLLLKGAFPYSTDAVNIASATAATFNLRGYGT